jgi:hypothetical protein
MDGKEVLEIMGVLGRNKEEIGEPIEIDGVDQDRIEDIIPIGKEITREEKSNKIKEPTRKNLGPRKNKAGNHGQYLSHLIGYFQKKVLGNQSHQE